jgi:hypothetical protein
VSFTGNAGCFKKSVNVFVTLATQEQLEYHCKENEITKKKKHFQEESSVNVSKLLPIFSEMSVIIKWRCRYHDCVESTGRSIVE